MFNCDTKLIKYLKWHEHISKFNIIVSITLCSATDEINDLHNPLYLHITHLRKGQPTFRVLQHVARTMANLVQTKQKVSRANLGRYHRFFVGQYATNSKQQVGLILRICA